MADELRDQFIACEGLGFCIYSYIPANKIADGKLRSLWTKARRAMQDIVEHLGQSKKRKPRRRAGALSNRALLTIRQ